MYDYNFYVKTRLDEFNRYRANEKLVKEALAGAQSRRKLPVLLALSRALLALLVSLR